MTHSDFHLFAAYVIGFLSFYSLILIYGLFRQKKQKGVWKQPIIKNGITTKWGWVVRHPENLKLGENTDIGFGTFIQAEYGVDIEKNVQIGAHCAIYSRNSIDNTHSQIIIAEGARIGAGTIILPKHQSCNETLVIGRNSKIGALSLIKDDIHEGDIVAGIPAKSIIRKE